TKALVRPDTSASHPASGVCTPDPLSKRSPAALGNGLLQCRRGTYETMPLMNLVIALIVVGVALYLINRYIPMASSIKTILNIVVVVAVCVWVLQASGLWGSITG